jgi:hypothetical protein
MPFDEIHTRLLGSDSYLVDEVNKLLHALSVQQVKEVSPGPSFNKPKILWEVQNYVQLSIHRVVELGEGATNAWNASRPATCFILTRALMENVAALVDVTFQIEGFVQDNKFIEIHTLVVNRLMGGKLQKFPVEVQIPNILTAIDKTDKYFPNHRVRELYDFLSEFAHPNSLGMHGLYASIDPSTHILKIDPSFGMTKKHFTVIAQSLFRALNIFGNTILKIESLYPDIIRLSIDDAKSHGGCA